MFSKFLEFVKEQKHYHFDSSEQFLKSMGGRSFLLLGFMMLSLQN